MILTCWRVRGAILIASRHAAGRLLRRRGTGPNGRLRLAMNYGLEQVAFQLDIRGRCK